MGFFDDFFTSPRERTGREAGSDYRNRYDRLQGDVGTFTRETSQLPSNLQGIKSLGDLSSRFGLRKRTAADVSRSFDPARANLATRLARSRSAAGSRISASNATPELTFAPIESAFGDAFGQLESQAALEGLRAETEDERYMAELLNRIYGQQDQFSLARNAATRGAFGLQQNALAGGQNQLQQYLQSLSPDSSFDDLLALVEKAPELISGGEAIAGLF